MGLKLTTPRSRVACSLTEPAKRPPSLTLLSGCSPWSQSLLARSLCADRRQKLLSSVRMVHCGGGGLGDFPDPPQGDGCPCPSSCECQVLKAPTCTSWETCPWPVGVVLQDMRWGVVRVGSEPGRGKLGPNHVKCHGTCLYLKF